MKHLQTIFILPFKSVDISKLIEKAMEKNEDRILDLNRRQLDSGLGADGKSIGRYKNFKYKNRWQPVDLLKTGEFRKKFTLSRSKGKKQAEIFSQDFKQPILEKRYGKEIQGLNAQNTQTAGDIIKPDMQEEFKTQLLK